MKSLLTFHKRYPRLALYFLLIEVIYILYELALPLGTHDGRGLALGLLLTVGTLPSSLLAPWLQWNTAELFGFTPGDSHAFWPRFLAWQIPIFVNVFIFYFYLEIKSSAKKIHL